MADHDIIRDRLYLITIVRRGSSLGSPQSVRVGFGGPCYPRPPKAEWSPSPLVIDSSPSMLHGKAAAGCAAYELGWGGSRRDAGPLQKVDEGEITKNESAASDGLGIGTRQPAGSRARVVGLGAAGCWRKHPSWWGAESRSRCASQRPQPSRAGRKTVDVLPIVPGACPILCARTPCTKAPSLVHGLHMF